MSSFFGSKRLGKIGEVVTYSVLAAPSSRAAVSLSYLTARAKSECWEIVVNLVSLALG